MKVEPHLSPLRMFERVCVQPMASAAHGALLRSLRLEESLVWLLEVPHGGRGRGTPAGWWQCVGPGPVDWQWGMRGKMREKVWGWRGQGRRPTAKEGKAGADSGGGGPAHWHSGLGETPNVPQ